MQANSTVKKLGYIPEAIMIHVPENYFGHEFEYVSALRTYEQHKANREHAFRKFYEAMGNGHATEDCFYHFISTCPAASIAENITRIYVCFQGKVQYKAILVKFMRNEIVDLPTYRHLTPRNWCVTTGPVVKAPEDFLLKDYWKGAKQGFRYTKELF